VIAGRDPGNVKHTIRTGSKGLVRSLDLQTDGNLVVYRQTGEPIWNTGSDDFSAFHANDADGYWNSDLNDLDYGETSTICDPHARGHCASAVTDSSGTARILCRGQALKQGERLVHPAAGGVELRMQSDGNLVLYDNNEAVWDSGTDEGHGQGPYMLIHDVRDELKIVNGHGKVLWESDAVVCARIERRDDDASFVGYDGEDEAYIIGD